MQTLRSLPHQLLTVAHFHVTRHSLPPPPCFPSEHLQGINLHGAFVLPSLSSSTFWAISISSSLPSRFCDKPCRKCHQGSSHISGSLSASCSSYTGNRWRRMRDRLSRLPRLRSCCCKQSSCKCNCCRSKTHLLGVRGWRHYPAVCCRCYIESSQGAIDFQLSLSAEMLMRRNANERTKLHGFAFLENLGKRQLQLITAPLTLCVLIPYRNPDMGMPPQTHRGSQGH